MKTLKKSFSIILCLSLVFGIVAVFGVGINKETGLKVSAVFHSVGDLVEFGTYPQREVKDSETLVLLNSQTLSWASYGYYSGTGTWDDGQMTAKDYMKYADVTVNGTKYRAVKFTEYRPCCTGFTSSNSQQDDNGYEINNTYWFQFEPIKWRVLDPATGFILCESIIDSQAFNNYVKSNGSDENGTAYWGDEGCTYYANNYEKSSIRAWLNDDFYHTAFSSPDKGNIKTTHLENKAYSPTYSEYDCADTDDKVFLLSYSDALNTNYGFSSNNSDYDKARRAQGTDYAKCQGLYVYRNSGSEYDGNSYWRLRSPGDFSYSICYVINDGYAYNYFYNTDNTSFGVRAALKISNLNNLPIVGHAGDVNPPDSSQATPVSQSWYIKRLTDSDVNYRKVDISYPCDYLTNPFISVEWRDSLFWKSSTEYNKEIDLIGGALSAAAEDEEGQYIVPAYNKLGFTNDKISLYSYPDHPTLNRSDALNILGNKFADDKTFAFSIASKKCVDGKTLIIITARGTKTGIESMLDLNGDYDSTLNEKRVYNSYLVFAEDILYGLKDYINLHPNLKNEDLKFLITGHSLGGGAANLSAAYLTKNTGTLGLNYSKSSVFCYTYGAVSPLVDGQVESGYENIFNTFNYYDTYGPHGNGYPLGFKPAGNKNYNYKFGIIRDFKYDNKVYHRVASKVLGQSTANHDMPGYLYAVAGGFADDKNYAVIQCPVDVEVRSEGKVVGRIKNNAIDENVTSISCAAVDDAKIFVFEKGVSYEFVQTGTDVGTMNITFGNTSVNGETKDFSNIALEKGKMMLVKISENEAVRDYSLYVTDASGNQTAEINTDGSETPIKLTLWQRIVRWFENLIAKIKALFSRG